MNQASREKGARPWRTGQSVGRTVYDANDALIGTLDTPELAKRAVDAVNQVDKLDASWLVKDFNVLYRAALDATAEPGNLQRIGDLRAQLERLREGFNHTEEVKRYLRERELGG